MRTSPPAPSSLLARSIAVVLGGTAATVLVAVPALAHPGHGALGLADGLAHPVTGPDHLLAMVAVGVVAATDLRHRIWAAPAAFVGGMVVGGVAGLAGVPFPGAEQVVVGSVILLGLVVAGALHGRSRWLLPVLVAVGVAHGHAHGAEAPAAAHPALYLVGFLAATVALHGVGAGVGTTVRGRDLVRAGLGGATVVAGTLLLLA